MIQRIRDGLVHFGIDETTVPNNKTYLKNTENQSLTSVKYKDGRVASKSLSKLMGGNYFTNPKDHELLSAIFSAVGFESEDIVLDFFAGSGTTGHATLALNQTDGGSRKFILVQLPEPVDDGTDAAAAGYKNIADIARDRIRRVGVHIKESSPLSTHDVGFRSLKLSPSAFSQWSGVWSDTDESNLIARLEGHANHIAPDAANIDVLYEILIKEGFPPTEIVKNIEFDDKKIYSLAEGALVLCLDRHLDQDILDYMADLEPLRVICLDAGFQGNDQLKANAVQTFKARARSRETAIEFRTV